MKQNKGFTLIELLAVIVILAIIALIATPIVLNMISSARESAAKSSSLGYIDSIEYYAGFSQAQDADIQLGYDKKVPGAVTCTLAKAEGASTATWSGGAAYNTIDTTSEETGDACSVFMTAVDTKSKGKAPDAASIILDASGKVQNNSTLTYGKYVCTYTNGDVSCN